MEAVGITRQHNRYGMEIESMSNGNWSWGRSSHT